MGGFGRPEGDSNGYGLDSGMDGMIGGDGRGRGIVRGFIG